MRPLAEHLLHRVLMAESRKKRRGHGFLCLLAAVLLLGASTPTVCDAGSGESGYFFLSARPTAKGVRMLEAQKDEEKKKRLRPEYYTTTIHGPFRTRIEARRALRARKSADSEYTYYTRIYKL
jgi:hypothetical protein